MVTSEVSGSCVRICIGGEWKKSFKRKAEKILSDAAVNGVINVCLDFKGIKEVESSTIDCIISAIRTCSDKKGTLVVANPGDILGDLIEMLGVGSIVKVVNADSSDVFKLFK